MFSVRDYMPRALKSTSIAAGESNRVGRPRLRDPVARVSRAGKPKRVTARNASSSLLGKKFL